MKYQPRESSEATPYGVHCTGPEPEMGIGPCNSGKIIFLTHAEYMRQLNRPDSRWECPRCGQDAYWDDDNYALFE